MNWLNLLKDQKGNLAWSAVLLIMVTSAYLAQDSKIEELSLELGDLRATVKYQEQAINYLSSECHPAHIGGVPK